MPQKDKKKKTIDYRVIIPLKSLCSKDILFSLAKLKAYAKYTVWCYI